NYDELIELMVLCKRHGKQILEKGVGFRNRVAHNADPGSRFQLVDCALPHRCDDACVTALVPRRRYKQRDEIRKAAVGACQIPKLAGRIGHFLGIMTTRVSQALQIPQLVDPWSFRISNRSFPSRSRLSMTFVGSSPYSASIPNRRRACSQTRS